MPDVREPRVGDVWRCCDGEGYEHRTVQDVAEGQVFWTDGFGAGQSDLGSWAMLQEEGLLALAVPAQAERIAVAYLPGPDIGNMEAVVPDPQAGEVWGGEHGSCKVIGIRPCDKPKCRCGPVVEWLPTGGLVSGAPYEPRIKVWRTRLKAWRQMVVDGDLRLLTPAPRRGDPVTPEEHVASIEAGIWCKVMDKHGDSLRALSEAEPAPEPNDRPAVWDLVISDMRERYGTPLQPGNGRDALVDAYQEALDLAVYLRQAIEERGAALTRAEQVERERDEALARCDVLRGLADQAAADLGLMARRMEQAQSARGRARADSRRAKARAAVVVWGQWAGVLGIDHDGDSWALVVSRGKPESNTGWDVEEFAFPRTCDDILRDIPDHAVDAIAATPGCPETLRVGWEGVRG